ncbi:MAG: hypothetical protein ACI4TX_02945 [Christensenellales bacterium]
MFKLWAKIIKDDKIINDLTYEQADNFHLSRLSLYMADICNTFDIETPIILNKHYEHISLFNTTTFLATDFITMPNFDKLVIERID